VQYTRHGFRRFSLKRRKNVLNSRTLRDVCCMSWWMIILGNLRMEKKESEQKIIYYKEKVQSKYQLFVNF